MRTRQPAHAADSIQAFDPGEAFRDGFARAHARRPRAMTRIAGPAPCHGLPPAHSTPCAARGCPGENEARSPTQFPSNDCYPRCCHLATNASLPKSDPVAWAHRDGGPALVHARAARHAALRARRIRDMLWKYG